MHHDEQHLVVLAGQRPLRTEHLIEVEVLAIAQRFAEVPVNALALELDVRAEGGLA